MHSLVSVRLILFLASLFIFGVGIFLIQKDSHSIRGGDDFVRRKNRKTIGYILLFPAALLFALATLNDTMSTDSSVRAIDPVAAAVAQAYVPPVLSKPVEVPQAPRDTWRTRLQGTNTDFNAPTPPRPASAPAVDPRAIPFATLPVATPPPVVAKPSTTLSPTEQLQADLEAASARIATNPKDAEAYNARGNLYAAKRDWESAARDFQNAVMCDPANAKAKFNLAEMSFQQKQYDVSKASFAALEQDPDVGDLAAYKAFLSDLFGGQLDAAGKDLDAFNQVGSNASYYFANAAWAINHRKPDEARDWLGSASRIYPEAKLKLYAASLFELGYLPLRPAPSN